MTLKEKIYDHFLQMIDEKIERLQKLLAGLKETGANETKRTAGDKHETALAMIQIEQANQRAQLKEALDQKAAFERIPINIPVQTVVSGSLVITDKGIFFVSIGLGKATVDGMVVFALSPQSPLGSKLMGMKMNDMAEVNNIRYRIEDIK